jgi:anhydro-N-acetylmuramic acid kinase
MSADTDRYYIGLMSGTSMDGIDAALVRFGDHRCDIVGTHRQPYPELLRADLRRAVHNPETFTVDSLGSMDNWVAECFGSAALTVAADSKIEKELVNAIGSHGQTIRHQPHAERPFTLQIGDPNRIAATTGITTVADFRRRDIALGGEGAPLAPAFHQWLFAESNSHCVVLNIGGIANVTVLADQPDATIGFDTGPGNTLLDAWINEHQSKAYDDGGVWADSGEVIQPLLQTMLADPFLSAAPPKSTGFEYFNLRWLQQALEQCRFQTPPQGNDIQATLAEFTARSIALAIRKHAPRASNVLVCGGGVHNQDLMSRMAKNMHGVSVSSTEAFGLDPDWVEAAAFAWLAMRTIHRLPGNLPSVTGAAHPAVLGGLFFGTG